MPANLTMDGKSVQRAVSLPGAHPMLYHLRVRNVIRDVKFYNMLSVFLEIFLESAFLAGIQKD